MRAYETPAESVPRPGEIPTRPVPSADLGRAVQHRSEAPERLLMEREEAALVADGPIDLLGLQDIRTALYGQRAFALLAVHWLEGRR